MRIGVHGATGRMGQLVLGEVLRTPELTLHAAVTRGQASLVGADAGEVAGCGHRGVTITSAVEALHGADVVVDFSHPLGFAHFLERLGDVPLVSGTTGLDAAGEEALAAYAERTATLHAANFSTGVAVLRHLVALTAGLVPEWDAEVVESHHRRKVDAPSGTARALVDSIESGRGEPAIHVHGREGVVGERPLGDIGVHALRLGDVVGEHTVSFGGSGEVLRLGHSALDRRVFAVGAVRAAQWLAGRGPGRYRFAQVVGLEPAPAA